MTTRHEFDDLLRGAGQDYGPVDFSGCIKGPDILWGEVERGETRIERSRLTGALIMHRVSLWLFVCFEGLFLQERWRLKNGIKFRREAFGQAATETLALIDREHWVAQVTAAIRAFKEELDLTVTAKQLDFHKLLNLYGPYEHKSSVYPGISITEVHPVLLDLAKLGDTKRRWKRGRKIHDRGAEGDTPTIIGCTWGPAPDKMLQQRCEELTRLEVLQKLQSLSSIGPIEEVLAPN